MRRALSHLVALSVVVTVAGGCNPARGKPPDLSAYRGVVEHGIFAWAWGGAAGFEGEDEAPIRVLFQPDPVATKYRLLSCDPAESSCESLSQFGDLAIVSKPFGGGMLGEFRTRLEDVDRRLVVIADRDAELLRSDTIDAPASSQPTRFDPAGLLYDRVAGTFAWPSVPDADLYLLTLTEDESREAASGIATYRRSWTYPQLVGIARYFHDPAEIGDLRRGAVYGALLFVVDEHLWTTTLAAKQIEP